MLSDLIFKPVYTNRSVPSNIDFFEQALSQSSNLDIGLGYFSTASINVLNIGFARFISEGGVMRLYINQDITEEDYILFQRGQEPNFESKLIESFEELKKTFSSYNNYFFSCLSYLIDIKRLQIKIVVPLDGGIAHEKYGIFKDKYGNKVSFTGSLNLTSAALLRNKESIDCSCSWKGEDSLEKINIYENQWEDVWYERDPTVKVYGAYNFCNVILKTYPKKDLSELIKEEELLIKRRKEESENPLDNFNSGSKGPHFPYEYKDGPLPYQKEAYDNWVKHRYQGIFAMATGTGKTVTSLNCALERYKVNGFYRLIIVVPSLALVDQWYEEVTNFGFSENLILIGSTNKDWKSEVSDLRLFLTDTTNFVIIATYDSFILPAFKGSLPYLSKNALIIADEAHNIGATKTLPVFENLIIKERIALSATPNRAFDEDGTSRIAHIFGESIPPYTYEFTMRKAIAEERLCPYYYYPKIAYLTDEEMQKYVNITKKLMLLSRDENGNVQNAEDEMKLLLKRKAILHKSESKFITFKNILHDIGEDNFKYTFIYCPEGSKNNQDDYTQEEAKRIMNKYTEETKKEFPNKNLGIYIGETSREQRKLLLESFTDGEIDAIFAMKCLDEGVDVPRAEYGIFISSTGNPRQFIQRRGRLLRRHKDKDLAKIYDIIVVPNINSRYYQNNFYKIERNMVMGELRRVAHFASIAKNYYSDMNGNRGIYYELKEITDYYGISLSQLINEIES